MWGIRKRLSLIWFRVKFEIKFRKPVKISGYLFYPLKCTRMLINCFAKTILKRWQKNSIIQLKYALFVFSYLNYFECIFYEAEFFFELIDYLNSEITLSSCSTFVSCLMPLIEKIRSEGLTLYGILFIILPESKMTSNQFKTLEKLRGAL